MNFFTLLRIGLVSVSAIIITALSIDAYDTVTGSQGTLLASLLQSKDVSDCPTGMVLHPAVTSFRCVDRYEASPGETCPHQVVQSVGDSVANYQTQACTPRSVAGAHPWTFVNRQQAAALCARSGKRLPSALEWYEFSRGADLLADECVVHNQSMQVTGSGETCKSPVGVYDVIGNVWEWVTDDVFDGVYNGRTLPASGYVAQVDAAGIATLSKPDPEESFSEAYFWSATEGSFGMVRGGYFGSRSDAGVYAVQARTNPNEVTPGIGFRCVK